DQSGLQTFLIGTGKAEARRRASQLAQSIDSAARGVSIALQSTIKGAALLVQMNQDRLNKLTDPFTVPVCEVQLPDLVPLSK
ncbi:MAG: hypothetical protein JO069_12780, partial [Verrucomicrobia bacterium]|nr:hypothetical protein [Verrucomicrobiota bacterium]